MSPTPARVAFFTRTGCHLCDEARPVVEAVCRRTGEAFTEHDVDADAGLRRLYTDKVPVVTVDGTVVDFWRVDERRLQERLTARQ